MPRSKIRRDRARLARTLAGQVATLLREGAYARGDSLPERALAQRLRVSRSPVRSALGLLEQQGIVTARPGGGYAVGKIRPAAKRSAPTDTEDAYFRLADDRLRGLLPDRITENELLRRYPMARADLAHLLRRAASEGWMERLPGHGWAFLPMVTSREAYAEGYRFRLAIEPAAILEPGFVLDREGLIARRREQEALIAGGLASASHAEIFELNSALHETITACGNNRFFSEALKRINRLRRLMEYRRRLNRAAAITQCREHIVLIDLLLSGRRRQAAAMLRTHLASVGVAKSQKPD